MSISCCKECGVPRLLSISQAWREGCIVDTSSGAASLCIYEASYPTAMIRESEAALGIPLNHIVFLAGMHAAVKVLGVLHDAHPLVARLLFSAPLHGLTERMLVAFARAIGVARVDIIERARGGTTRVRIHDPFDLDNCLAIIAGVLQIADGHPVSYEVLRQNGDCVVEFSPSPEDATKSETYRRMAAADLVPARLSASAALPRCRRCGAPRGVGEQFTFDMRQGLITENASGERVILMGDHGMNTIVREMEAELGNLINEIFTAFEKRNFARKLASGAYGDGPWDAPALRAYLALRGLGMLTAMEETEERTTFDVANAFVPTIVAGRLAALWEKRNGRECSCVSTVSGSSLNVALV